jgi:hypothetical protein
VHSVAAAPSLAFRLLPGRFAVVRLESAAEPPGWALDAPFWSVTRTPAELSVVCQEERVPPDARQERGWRCLEARGPFDLSQAVELLRDVGHRIEEGSER